MLTAGVVAINYYYYYCILSLSDTAPIHLILNKLDSKPIRYQTYQIPNLSDTEPFRSFQILYYRT